MIPFCSSICFLLQNSPQFHLEYPLYEAKFLFIKYSLKAQKKTKSQRLTSGGYGGSRSKSNGICGISMLRIRFTACKHFADLHSEWNDAAKKQHQPLLRITNSSSLVHISKRVKLDEGQFTHSTNKRSFAVNKQMLETPNFGFSKHTFNCRKWQFYLFQISLQRKEHIFWVRIVIYQIYIRARITLV